jgi:hypothetical protein
MNSSDETNRRSSSPAALQLSSSNKNDDDDAAAKQDIATDIKTALTPNDTSSNAGTAGVVRGVGRSVVRQIGRVPIGSLPNHAATSSKLLPRMLFRKRLPFRRIARVSNRLATGIDALSTASEHRAHQQPTTTTPKLVPTTTANRARAFLGSLIKNSLLGIAVFETYGFVISHVAAATRTTNTTALAAAAVDGTAPLPQDSNDDDDNDETTIPIKDEPDDYAQVSLATHASAGFLAGSVHGIAIGVWEGARMPQQLPRHALHHAVAHSVLFASYESMKRSALNIVQTYDPSLQVYGGAYLLSFGMAGGLAGSLQHVVSHCTEQLLLVGTGGGHVPLRNIVAPTLQPTLLAFPASAIGFVAFEYGKKFA